MADISEFNINNTLYNLKDTQARNNIDSLSTNIENNYLPLSGGTMTGTIIPSNSTGIQFPHEVGYYTDQYGNFIHSSTNITSTFNILNYNKQSKFSVNFESGAITLGTPLAIEQGGTGATTAAAAWTALGGGNLGKLDSLSIAGLSNAWTGTLSSGATRTFSLISAATAAVIFWVRATTFGVAATSGYSSDGIHILFDSGINSPTFSGTGTSFTIKNNRDSVIYLIVFGANST